MLRAKNLARGVRRQYLKKKGYLETEEGARLPESYKNFFNEWRREKPKPVHWIEEKGRYKLTEKGEIHHVINVPIPNKFTMEQDQGIWGGESLIEGYRRPAHRYETHVPEYWIPRLLDHIVYSEVLDKYLNVTVTQRTIDLIHEHCGFDEYLLATRACDLNSLLACKIKRKILLALHDRTLYPNDSAKREKVLGKYGKYLEGKSREDIDWYGLSFHEARDRFLAMEREKEEREKEPLKVVFRREMIEELKEMKLSGAFDEKKDDASLLKKFNPFAKL